MSLPMTPPAATPTWQCARCSRPLYRHTLRPTGEDRRRTREWGSCWEAGCREAVPGRLVTVKPL